MTALNMVRPNAEQVSLRLAGTSDDQPTIIGGSVFCGGNSATLMQDDDKINNAAYPNYPVVEIKIGSYIKADKVFLGCNGENMVDQSSGGLLEQYAGNVNKTNTDGTTTSVDFSTLDLTDSNIFAKYMDGCAMDLIPQVKFDNA